MSGWLPRGSVSEASPGPRQLPASHFGETGTTVQQCCFSVHFPPDQPSLWGGLWRSAPNCPLRSARGPWTPSPLCLVESCVVQFHAEHRALGGQPGARAPPPPPGRPHQLRAPVPVEPCLWQDLGRGTGGSPGAPSRQRPRACPQQAHGYGWSAFGKNRRPISSLT